MSDPIDDVFREFELHRGRSVGSTTTYRNAFPDAFLIANAWVGDEAGKLWGGDLDLTTADASRLCHVAARLGRTLYVLRETDPDLKGDEVCRLAEAIVTADAVTLTPHGVLSAPEAAANNVRVSRRAKVLN